LIFFVQLRIAVVRWPCPASRLPVSTLEYHTTMEPARIAVLAERKANGASAAVLAGEGFDAASLKEVARLPMRDRSEKLPGFDAAALKARSGALTSPHLWRAASMQCHLRRVASMRCRLKRVALSQPLLLACLDCQLVKLLVPRQLHCEKKVSMQLFFKAGGFDAVSQSGWLRCGVFTGWRV